MRESEHVNFGMDFSNVPKPPPVDRSHIRNLEPTGTPEKQQEPEQPKSFKFAIIQGRPIPIIESHSDYHAKPHGSPFFTEPIDVFVAQPQASPVEQHVEPKSIDMGGFPEHELGDTINRSTDYEQVGQTVSSDRNN